MSPEWEGCGNQQCLQKHLSVDGLSQQCHAWSNEAIGLPWESCSPSLPSKLFNQALDVLRGHSRPNRHDSIELNQALDTVLSDPWPNRDKRLGSGLRSSCLGISTDGGHFLVGIETSTGCFLLRDLQKRWGVLLSSLAARPPGMRATSGGLQRTKRAPGAANVDNRICDH